MLNLKFKHARFALSTALIIGGLYVTFYPELAHALSSWDIRILGCYLLLIGFLGLWKTLSGDDKALLNEPMKSGAKEFFAFKMPRRLRGHVAQNKVR